MAEMPKEMGKKTLASTCKEAQHEADQKGMGGMMQDKGSK